MPHEVGHDEVFGADAHGADSGNRNYCAGYCRLLPLYRADYNQQFSQRTRTIWAYVKPQGVSIPADLENGINLLRRNEITGLRYYYFANFRRSFMLEHAPKHAPNHGILACAWHPMSNIQWARRSSATPVLAPYVHRGLLDGSVLVLCASETPNLAKPERLRSPSQDIIENVSAIY